jgi:ABC-type multidrug transport system fused ATPase/permease subunit
MLTDERRLCVCVGHLQVCNSYSLTVEPNTVVALVGASGSGKSTLVNLIERFYDPQRGCVKLDGVPLTSLNVRWLRHQIGYVGQEPRLFSGTIMENIAHGDSEATVSESAIVAAAKKANAHDFIMKFPQVRTRFLTKFDEANGTESPALAHHPGPCFSPAHSRTAHMTVYVRSESA